MITIRFTFDTAFGPFSDALNLPDDHTLTDAELEAMKQDRLANWLAIVNPLIVEEPVVDVPTEE
jgi:hypothetical protein